MKNWKREFRELFVRSIGSAEDVISFIQKEKQISFDKGYESKMSKYHKAYYQANKEKMNARAKEYYRKNKALLKLKRWEKLNKESK